MSDLVTDFDVSADSPEPDSASSKVRPQPKKKLPLYGKIGLVWIILVVLASVISPFLTADPIRNDTGRVLQACGDGTGLPLYDPLACSDLSARPTAKAKSKAKAKAKDSDVTFEHIAGVDSAGQDVFSMVIIGAKNTLMIAFGAIAVAMLLGGTLGVISGYFGGKVNTAISFLLDVLVSFPQIVLAFAIAAFVQGNADQNPPSLTKAILNMIITLGIVAAPLLGRITRASTLTWAQREFVVAAKAMGARDFRIIVRDVFPNVLPALLSITTLAVGVAIVAEGSLALIGLGLPNGTAVSWGTVMATGGKDFSNYSIMVFLPGAFIVLTVMALNMLGDAIRQKFDVKESAL